MAEFDTISKHLIHTYPADFARFALAQDDLEVLEVLDTEQPTVEAHRMDSLMRVCIDGTEALVHNEFQTTDSTHLSMPLRMAGYIGRALEQHGLPVYSHVIYLRPDAGRHDLGEYGQDRMGYRVVIQYKVIRLSEQDGQAVLDGGYTGLLPFAPLMQPPEGLAAEQWLQQCVQRAETLPMAEATQANFLTDLAIMSGLVYDYQIIQRIIPEDIMNESSVIQHFAEQGIEQGREQVGREFLLDVLALRFQPEDVQQLASRIEAIEDVQHLKQLHRAAIQMPTLEAFRRLLEADE